MEVVAANGERTRGERGGRRGKRQTVNERITWRSSRQTANDREKNVEVVAANGEREESRVAHTARLAFLVRERETAYWLNDLVGELV